jgi:hypothetical protein
MSVSAIAWAWNTELKPTEKIVLLALCDHVNDENGKCWPSITHLQKKTGLSRPSVWKSINRLIEKGLVERCGIGSSGSTTTYRVNVGNGVTQTRLPNNLSLGNGVTHALGNDFNTLGNQVNKVGNVVTSEPSRTVINHKIPAPPARTHEEAFQPQPENAPNSQIPHEPKTPQDWAQYFIQRCRYRIDQAVIPKSMTMFRQWIAQGVTLEDVEDAAAAAEARLNGYPSNPTLYVSFEAVSIVSDRRGSRPNLEAAITDLARRAAPRPIWRGFPFLRPLLVRDQTYAGLHRQKRRVPLLSVRKYPVT